MKAHLAFCCALTFAVASPAQDLALKAGESADLFPVYWVQNCKSNLKGFLGVDVLSGPSGVQAALREEPVEARRQGCASKVPGAMLVLKADPAAAEFDGTVRLRVRYSTEDGEKQSVHTVKLFIAPVPK